MINNIKAREILDSKGNPTIAVELETQKGVFGAQVPSGTSEGKYEAVEVRDGGKRYQGRGVLKAVKNVNEIIAPKLKGKNPTKQKEIDELMIKLDATENKSKLGANAILAVSIAVCRAGAAAEDISLWKYISQIAKTKPALPAPSLLLIEGGLHAGNNLDFQEFMIVPLANSFAEKLRIATEIYNTLGSILEKVYGQIATNVGYEGGFAPPISSTQEALNLITKAAKDYQDTKIGLDCAVSHLYKDNKYQLEGTIFTKEGLLTFYQDLIDKYPIVFLEDPFSEEDWQGFQEITKKLGKKITIVGDDLLTTNVKRIKEAQDKKACNGAVIKPDQIGTVSETLEAVKLAKSYDWKIMVSHRSGDTCDDFIADLAVGIKADFIKAGAPARGERVAKYNRLLKIEDELKK